MTVPAQLFPPRGTMRFRAASPFFIRPHRSVGPFLASLTALSLSIACGIRSRLNQVRREVANAQRQHRVDVGRGRNARLRCARLPRDRQAARIGRRRRDDRVDRPVVRQRVVHRDVGAHRPSDFRFLQRGLRQLDDRLARDHDDRQRSVASACHERHGKSQRHRRRLGGEQRHGVGGRADVRRADVRSVGAVMDDVSGGPVRAGSVQIVDGASAGTRVDADGNGNYAGRPAAGST